MVAIEIELVSVIKVMSLIQILKLPFVPLLFSPLMEQVSKGCVVE